MSGGHILPSTLEILMGRNVTRHSTFSLLVNLSWLLVWPRPNEASWTPVCFYLICFHPVAAVESGQIRSHPTLRRCSSLISKNNPVWLIWNRNTLMGCGPTSLWVHGVLPHRLSVSHSCMGDRTSGSVEIKVFILREREYRNRYNPANRSGFIDMSVEFCFCCK